MLPKKGQAGFASNLGRWENYFGRCKFILGGAIIILVGGKMISGGAKIILAGGKIIMGCAKIILTSQMFGPITSLTRGPE